MSQRPSPRNWLPRKAELKWFWVTAALTALVLGLVGLFGHFSEVGFNGLLPGTGGKTAQSTLKLKDQTVYQIKKKLDFLDMQVIRVVSKQQPQEFLIVDGVSSGLVDRIFAQNLDLGWVNLMANQFLKLREGGEGSGPPVSIEVQQLKTLSRSQIQQGSNGLPYWHLEIRFKLSNESSSRFYQVGVVRHAKSPFSSPAGKDTLLVGYAQKEAFQKALLSDLMTHLRVERN